MAEQEQERAEWPHDPSAVASVRWKAPGFSVRVAKNDMQRCDDKERDRNGDCVGAHGRK